MLSIPVSGAPVPGAPVPGAMISAGTPDFKRTNRALFFGGFSCFALL